MHYKLRAAALVIIGAVLFAACKKKEEGPAVLSTRDNLLGTWRRSMRGIDKNGNHRIDSSETDYTPATKATDTIILTLIPDATFTRSQVFKGQSFGENGTWHLQAADSEIVLQPTTSTSAVDTFRLDSVSQEYFLQHRVKTAYYESYRRP